MGKDLFDFDIGGSSKPSSSNDELLRKARSLCARGMYDKALDIYNQILDDDFECEEAYIGLLRVHSEDFTIFEGKQIDQDVHAIQKMFPKCNDEEYSEFIKQKEGKNKSQVAPDPKAEAKPAAAPKKDYGPIKKVFDPIVLDELFPWMSEDEVLKMLNEQYLAETNKDGKDKTIVLELNTVPAYDNKAFCDKYNKKINAMLFGGIEFSIYLNYWEAHHMYYTRFMASAAAFIAEMYALPEWRLKQYGDPDLDFSFGVDYLKVKTKKQLLDFVYSLVQTARDGFKLCHSHDKNDKVLKDAYEQYKELLDKLDRVRLTIR